MTIDPGPLAVLHAGLVTSVGLSAPAACAAIRMGLTNHTETRFKDPSGEWITGAQVPLDRPYRGRERLLQMLMMSVEECLTDYDGAPVKTWPVLLCVAEPGRSGRLEGLDAGLLINLGERVGVEFDPEVSAVLEYGRVGVAVALARARELINSRRTTHVLIAGVDSLLTAPSLAELGSQDRLLTAGNSNGFVPGEAAGAVIVGPDSGRGNLPLCLGLGFAEERSTVNSDEPLRGDGLVKAMQAALQDAGCNMDDLDFRISDLSGEQYYFKEASLALSRILRKRKEEFDMWHPAECVGETGAAIGVVALAVVLMAFRKAYAPGARVLLHLGNDGGQRIAMVFAQRGSA